MVDILLVMLEKILRPWFIRRSLYEADVQELMAQNCTLLKLARDAHNLSSDALKELRGDSVMDETISRFNQRTLH